MKITLVRHTAVSPQWTSICYGHTDVPLADTFEEEAGRVREQLDLDLHDCILSSPLSRAHRLARYCVPEDRWDEIVLEDRLREMDFGSWEGIPWTQILNEDQDVFRFFEYFIDKPAPGGESLGDLAQRVAQLIDRLLRAGHRHPLLFCHGGVINAVRTMAGRMSIQEAFEQLLPYGSIMTVSVDELKWEKAD